MDVHEYQAKELLARFNVPVPAGGLAYSPEQAAYRARELGGEAWVVKAQVHAGGRGKAGGVKVCRERQDLWRAADQMLGKTLVTEQTGPAGKGVYRLLVEAGQKIARELYLGFVLDREHERIVIVGSEQGGMEIEEIAREHPESMHRRLVDPSVGLPAFQARDLAFALGFRGGEVAQAIKAIQGAYRAFRDLDATMVEINPLVVTEEGNVLALDCKMQVDDNALYRRPEVADMRDRSQEDPRETHAVDRGLSYVGLERRHRLHRQRRRPRHGDPRHDQAGRRRARQLPRHRRRAPRPERVAEAVSSVRPPGRPSVRKRSWSTSSPGSTAATGSPRGSCRRCTDRPGPAAGGPPVPARNVAEARPQDPGRQRPAHHHRRHPRRRPPRRPVACCPPDPPSTPTATQTAEVEPVR